MLIALLTAFLLGGGGGALGSILTTQAIKQFTKEVEVMVVLMISLRSRLLMISHLMSTK